MMSMRTLVVLGCAAALFSTGCNKLSTEYGKSKGFSGRSSLNGFGALRRTYEYSGFDSRDASRLTNRVLRSDTIVWTPQLLGPIDNDVTEWFDRWFLQGNKSLVYIIPDSGSESEYWTDAATIASPEMRLEYRKRSAKSINDRILWRLNRRPVTNSGWFDIDPCLQQISPDQLRGEWSRDLAEADSASKRPITIELAVREATSNANAAKTAINPPNNLGPTGPATPSYPFLMNSEPSESAVTMESQLKVDNGSSIVTEITSDDWNGSRIIVVAGGSLLTNYAFSRPFNRQLAEKIVAASTPTSVSDPRVAFMTSSWSSVPVSDNASGIPKASGMELLTVWPISLITMHGVLLTLVIGLVLLPIFGRPKRVHLSRQSDFGDHLDAVAALMNKAGGEQFARGRIAEYRKRIHGESVTAVSASIVSANPISNADSNSEVIEVE